MGRWEGVVWCFGLMGVGEGEGYRYSDDLGTMRKVLIGLLVCYLFLH